MKRLHIVQMIERRWCRHFVHNTHFGLNLQTKKWWVWPVGWFEICLPNQLHTAWFFVKCKCPNSYSVHFLDFNSCDSWWRQFQIISSCKMKVGERIPLRLQNSFLKLPQNLFNGNISILIKYFCWRIRK